MFPCGKTIYGGLWRAAYGTAFTWPQEQLTVFKQLFSNQLLVAGTVSIEITLYTVGTGNLDHKAFFYHVICGRWGHSCY
jgi:hypothetical protein